MLSRERCFASAESRVAEAGAGSSLPLGQPRAAGLWAPFPRSLGRGRGVSPDSFSPAAAGPTGQGGLGEGEG